ncbi:MAG: hypothetical protein IJT44_00705 [Clostridia bacterium]|nr:hypothetical protein [Clostridia bacterium]
MFSDMLHAFAEYKVLTAVLIVSYALLLFVGVKASRAVRRHNAARDAVLKKLREEAALRQKYGALTRETALSADAGELLHGTALCVQRALEDENDLTAAFRALPAPKQYVYAWNYLLCEDAETLSAFFRLNGKPLTDAALEGARAAFDVLHRDTFERGYRMFDPDDETVSVLPEDVRKLDEDFAAERDVLLRSIQQYIADHTDPLKGE